MHCQRYAAFKRCNPNRKTTWTKNIHLFREFSAVVNLKCRPRLFYIRSSYRFLSLSFFFCSVLQRYFLRVFVSSKLPHDFTKCDLTEKFPPRDSIWTWKFPCRTNSRYEKKIAKNKGGKIIQETKWDDKIQFSSGISKLFLLSTRFIVRQISLWGRTDLKCPEILAKFCELFSQVTIEWKIPMLLLF